MKRVFFCANPRKGFYLASHENSFLLMVAALFKRFTQVVSSLIRTLASVALVE
jgi:hypothetical protein